MRKPLTEGTVKSQIKGDTGPTRASAPPPPPKVLGEWQTKNKQKQIVISSDKPKMSYEEKMDKFLTKNAREAFHSKTSLEELPLRIEFGSSSHHPERKGGITTRDLVMWVKFLDNDWFRPYGQFDHEQINKMIEICKNDNQIVSLMELLSVTKE